MNTQFVVLLLHEYYLNWNSFQQRLETLCDFMLTWTDMPKRKQVPSKKVRMSFREAVNGERFRDYGGFLEV